MLVCHGRVGLVRATVSVGRKLRHGTGRIWRFTRFLSVQVLFTGYTQDPCSRSQEITPITPSRGDTHHASKNTKRVIHLPFRSANEIAPKHSQHPLILPILTTFSLHAAATVSLSVLASVATSCFRACPSYCCRPYRRPDFERQRPASRLTAARLEEACGTCLAAPTASLNLARGAWWTSRVSMRALQRPEW